MDDEHNELARYYLAIWKEMLWTLLGWPEARVMQWVEERGLWEYLYNPDDMLLYHETPQYWIKRLLVPETLKARLSNLELIDLESRILSAFEDYHHYHFPLGTDWRPFREKIEQILSEYGEHLPRLTPDE